MPKRMLRRLRTSKKCTPRRELVPRLRPGHFSISHSGRLRRRDARGRCAARVGTSGFQRALPAPSDMAPRLSAVRGRSTGVAALGCALACRPRTWQAADHRERRQFTDRMDALLISRLQRPYCPAALMRRCIPSCLPWSAGLAFDGAESLPERCLVVGVPGPCDPSFARTGPLPRPCICRESWRGHGARSLRSVRLGLVRRNRPA